jgi:serine/threonine protein kinase/tetratricopeptide (TPR) repeat protein
MSQPASDPKALFLAALDHEAPASRQAFLDEACGGNDELREKVQGLFRAYEQAGNFLGGSVSVAPTMDMPASNRMPFKAIGPYKLLQQIGEGGMGSVFMAEQTEPIQRKVALKLIKPGLNTQQTAARFEAERQALALMDHQNIAKVLDAGTTETGQPYFVMELVHGVPLTKYCDQQRLSPRERLKLFIPVCQAVQHAHQKGVIHRDLKPSNVLVAMYDGQPVPKVIDFGVAKALGQRLTDKTMFTEFGSIVGTLEYMSPEQAEHSQIDIDTRSDVYSLGVILYELLTGTTPLDKKRLKNAAILELLRIIKEEEPQKPSTRLSTTDALPSIAANRSLEPRRLSGVVRGELDWIVMKALEKDRNRRYETANGLAADILRHLQDEPVTACPPSASYRFQKFARRNKGILTAAGVVSATLLIGLVASTLATFRAQRAEKLAETRLTAETLARTGEADARRLAEQARVEAEAARDQAIAAEQQVARERDRAEEGFAQARAVVDQYLTQVSESQLLTAAGMQPLRRELLQSALQFYEGFLQQRGTDSTIKADLAAAQLRLRKVYEELGRTADAKSAINRARQLYQELLQQDPSNPDFRYGMARVHYYAGERPKAMEILEPLIQEYSERSEYQLQLAETYNVLAIWGPKETDPAERLRLHQKALALKESLVVKHPENLEYRLGLVISLSNLAGILAGKNLSEASDMYRRTAEHAEFVQSRNPHLIQNGEILANCYVSMGNHALQQGQADAAIELYRKAADLLRKLAIANPTVPRVQGQLAHLASDLARWFRDRGQPDDAKYYASMVPQALDRLPRETAVDRYNLACYHAVYSAAIIEGKSSPAAEELRESQEEAELAIQELQQAVAAGYSDFALLSTDKDLDSLRQRDDFQALQAQVEQTFRLAELTKSIPGVSPAERLNAQNQALEIRQQQAAKDPQNVRGRADLALNHQVIGQLQVDLMQWELAAASFAEARRLRAELVQLEPQNLAFQFDLATTLGLASRVAEQLGQREVAADLWNQQRNMLESLKYQQSDDLKITITLGEAHYARGYGLWRCDRYAEALPHWDEGYQLLSRALEQQPEDSTTRVTLRQATAARERTLADFLANRGFYTLAMNHWAHIPAAERHLSAKSETRMVALSAWLGHRDEYEESCRILMERFADKEPYEVADLCSLLPGCSVPAEQTLEVAKEAARLDGKNSSWVQAVLSRAKIRAGQFEDSAPTSAPYLFLNAVILWHRGDKPAAQADLHDGETKFVELITKTLRTLSAGQPLPSSLYDQDCVSLIRYRQSRREAWELIEGKVPALPAEALVDSLLWTRLGDQAEADKAVRAALAEVPTEPDALVTFAATIADLGHPEWTLAAYNVALERRPEAVELWLARARYHLQQGNHAAADADFTHAATLTPEGLNKFIEPGWWASAHPPDASGWITPAVAATTATVGSSPDAPASQPTAWHLVRPTMWEGEVKLRKAPGLKAAQTVYGLAYVYSPETRAVTLLVGGYAPLDLRLNGRLVYRWKSYSSHYNLDRVPILLQPGRNTLVVQLTGPIEDKSIIFRIGDTPLDRGLELAYLGVWDQALPLLKTAFAEDQQRVRGSNSWQFYAKALFQRGDQAGYQALRVQALDWAPTRASADTFLQVSLLCSLAPLPKEQAARAVQMVDDGLAKASSYKAAWMTDHQTVVYYRAGRFQEVLERVGTRGGSTWSALRALCHHRLGNVERAKTELNQAVSQRRSFFTMGPDGAASARVSAYRHGILDTTTDYALISEARALIAPDGQPDDAEIEAWRADVRKRLDAADQRLLPFEMSLIYDSKNPHRRLECGRAFAVLGDWERAQADFTKAVAMAPGDPEVFAARARIYADLNRFDEAAADVLTLLDENSALAKSSTWPDVRKQLEADLPQWPALHERVTTSQRKNPTP